MKEQMKKIALLSLSLILTSAYSVSIVLPSLLQHFSEYTTAQVEILISAPSFAITVMIVLNAWLSRYMKDRPMIVGGLLLLSVSGMVPVFVQEYPVVLASRIFLGIGIGLINAKAISIFSFYLFVKYFFINSLLLLPIEKKLFANLRSSTLFINFSMYPCFFPCLLIEYRSLSSRII